MNRSQLRISAVVLTVLMVVVGANALDHLPGSLHTQIAAERAALVTAKKQVDTLRGQIAGEVQSDPGLFSALPFGAQWPDRFSQAESQLLSVSRDIEDLTRLEKRDRRSDKQEVETLLAHEAKAR